MNTKIFTTLPQDAKNIRIEVFMKEQGFENEFDEIDNLCHHIVAFDEGKPIGTCRFFKENNHYTIGRVAVLKEYRNQHIGNLLLKSAEKEIKRINGDVIVVHAQVRVSSFYEKQGYIQFGQIDDDEGVPHVWMKKRYSIKLLYPNIFHLFANPFVFSTDKEQIATRIPKFTLTVKMLFSINASWNLSRVSLSIDKVTKNPSL